MKTYCKPCLFNLKFTKSATHNTVFCKHAFYGLAVDKNRGVVENNLNFYGGQFLTANSN